MNKYSTFSFSRKGFIGVFKASKKINVKSPDFPKTLLTKINDMLVRDTVDELLREDRNNLRAEKKRAWSPRRTRAPFYFRARGKSKVTSFKAALDLAQKVVEHLGPPWKESKRGCPPLFSCKKVTSALLVKHFRGDSFETLRTELEGNGFDCRKPEKKNHANKVPSKSELHWAMDKIPEEYLEEAMRLLDEWAARLHKDLFGADELDKFGVDGTESRCKELEEALIACRCRLRRTTNQINALIRLVTNTVSEVNSSKKENQKDLRKLLEKRKLSGRTLKGMKVFGDRDYDVEYNYKYAIKNGVELVIKLKMFHGKPYKGRCRKKVQARFSSREYKTRKVVERPFGNMYLRDENKIHYKRPDMKQKGEILRCIAHNMKAYFMQEGWAKVFKNLTPEENFGEVHGLKK